MVDKESLILYVHIVSEIELKITITILEIE